MTYYNAPTRFGDSKIENLEREVDCTEAEIAIAKRHGMMAWHLEGLRLYCRQMDRLLILRSSKFESRRFQFSSAHHPKPRDVKGKTQGGEVYAESSVYPGKTRFFSDYDILSLWQRCGNEYTRVVTCKPEQNFEPLWEVIDELNMYIGNRSMFQHGANDEFVDTNGQPKNPLNINESFIAFDEKRWIYELGNVMELKAFYAQHGLSPWIY